MFKNIIHFIKYNNLVTLAIAVVLAASGSAIAATQGLRQPAADTATDTVAGQQTDTAIENALTAATGVPIDNSALLNTDFESFDPGMHITAVSDDADAYYVSYAFASFDVANGAWVVASKMGKLTISKNTLGDVKLRDAIAKELREVSHKEIAYLKEVQGNEEKKSAVKKTIAIDSKELKNLVIDPQEKVPEKNPEKSLEKSSGGAVNTSNIFPTDFSQQQVQVAGAVTENQTTETQAPPTSTETATSGTATLNPMAVDFTKEDGSIGSDGLDDFSGKPMSDADALVRDGKTLIIPTSAVTTGSRIFLTPKTVSDEPLAVISKDPGVGFTVSLKYATLEPVEFDWLIVEEK